MGEGHVRQLIAEGESKTVEFKQTARINVATGDKDSRMELAILKTIAGFLNTDGGTLLVGVDDDGNVSGIEVDLPTFGKKSDLDGFELCLSNLITTSIGVIAAAQAVIEFEMIDGKTVCSVTVEPGNAPSYVKMKSTDFYARVGNSTRLLDTAKAVEYTKHQWS